MPRYTKDGGKYGYRRRYKKQPHEEIAKVINNLSTRQFRIMQELAKHGMGMYTTFREHLPPHPKKKVRPSSFEKYASAKNQADLAQQILQERQEHADHSSETHMGGGLGDAHNAVAEWAYDVALDEGVPAVTNWAIDQLDPETSEEQRELAQRGLRYAIETGVEYARTKDDEEEKIVYADEVPNEIPNEGWIDTILETGNKVMDTAGWIGGILGATADFLSEENQASPYDYPRAPY